MKKAFVILLAATMMLTTACASGAKETKAETKVETTAETTAETEEVEVVVFAAASMTETLTEIAELYKEVQPNVSLIFNFDSSGTLKTQIEEGATCDLFISAGQKQMNQIDIQADAEINTDGLNFVEEGTRMDLLENKVVLAVPDDNPKNIQTFDDMVEGLTSGSILLAMGNGDVPVGQYTQKILAYYELSEEELAGAGVITYGTNVKEVTTQVKEGTVDCGIIYCTDAYSAELNIVDDATAEMCGQVIYPAAVLNTSEHKAEALAFLEYLTTDEAMAIFESVGFVPAES
ncbi:molybdate ABC transporter substrate-binding protein [Frisingicoccus sp.]|uniref:molybdate ABC transporter substrate-binding protein n=1 Tax=Frisingicoccus sp. TaxID=1918627 RepID=UPI003870ABAC